MVGNNAVNRWDYAGMVDWEQVGLGAFLVVGGLVQGIGGLMVAQVEAPVAAQVVGTAIMLNAGVSIGLGIATFSLGFSEDPPPPPSLAHVVQEGLAPENDYAEGTADIVNLLPGLASSSITWIQYLNNITTSLAALESLYESYEKLNYNRPFNDKPAEKPPAVIYEPEGPPQYFCPCP